jgi:hypothetical protein
VPVAAAAAVALGFGLFQFVTFEQTAIDTIPPAESAPVFVPITPTPAPTLTPTSPPAPGAVAGDTWDGNYSALFRNRCGTCHVNTAVGGLSLASYPDALDGGLSGPGLVPGNPDASQVVLVQSAGNHPGQLTIDELNQVIEWIKAGAPEN